MVDDLAPVFALITSAFVALICYFWGSRYPALKIVTDSEGGFISIMLFLMFILAFCLAITIGLWFKDNHK